MSRVASAISPLPFPFGENQSMFIVGRGIQPMQRLLLTMFDHDMKMPRGAVRK
jgi:hypothetical protein